MTAIIDYDAGNLRSVEKAIALLGGDPVITRDRETILKADHVILPGVGAFGDAMEKLNQYGLTEVVREVAQAGIPLIGICLGMQLLFERSDESDGVPGIGVLEGDIIKIPDTPGLKIPHMGWNSLQILKDDPLFRHVRDGEYVYYVHSFYARDCAAGTLAASRYGNVDVTGVVRRGNVYGTQFHPEKSGDTGLRLLRAFAEL